MRLVLELSLRLAQASRKSKAWTIPLPIPPKRPQRLLIPRTPQLLGDQFHRFHNGRKEQSGEGRELMVFLTPHKMNLGSWVYLASFVQLERLVGRFSSFGVGKVLMRHALTMSWARKFA